MDKNATLILKKFINSFAAIDKEAFNPAVFLENKLFNQLGHPLQIMFNTLTGRNSNLKTSIASIIKALNSSKLETAYNWNNKVNALTKRFMADLNKIKAIDSLSVPQSKNELKPAFTKLVYAKHAVEDVIATINDLASSETGSLYTAEASKTIMRKLLISDYADAKSLALGAKVQATKLLESLNGFIENIKASYAQMSEDERGGANAEVEQLLRETTNPESANV